MAASAYFKKEATLEKNIKDVNSNGRALYLRKRQNALVRKGVENDWRRLLDTEQNEIRQNEELETGDEKKHRDARLREDIEQQFAKNVLQLKNEEILKEKRRQFLRINSPELRKLESQLLANSVAEIQRQQVLEKEAAKSEEKLRELQYQRDIETWNASNNMEGRAACENFRRKIQYRRDQQNQIICNEWKRMAKAEEKIRDQKLIDEAEDVLREEEKKVSKLKAETVAGIQAEAKMFISAREMWKAEEKRVIIEEEKRIAQANYEKECKEKQRIEEALRLQKQKDIAAEALAKELVRKENSRKNLDSLFKDACVLEVEKKFRERDRKEAENERKWSIYTKQAMRESHELKRDKIQKEKEEEDEYAKRLKDRIEAANKAERDKQIARRKKGIRYGEDLRAAIEDNAILHAKDVLRRQVLARKEEEQIAAERLEIQIERNNMLREYDPTCGLEK